MHGCSAASDPATPWTVALQAPLSMGFSRQEYWSGVPFPSPGDLPDPEAEPESLKSPALASGFFNTAPSGKLTAELNRSLLYLKVGVTHLLEGEN